MDLSNEITNLGYKVVHIKQGQVARIGDQHFTETDITVDLGKMKPTNKRAIAQAVMARVDRSWLGRMLTIRDVQIVLSGMSWKAYTAVGNAEN